MSLQLKHPPSRKDCLWTLALGLFLLGLPPISAAQENAPSPPLLQSATKLFPSPEREAYSWLNDKQIIILRNTKDYEQIGNIWKVDAHTGQERLISRMDNKVRTASGRDTGIRWQAWTPTLSSDGNWMVRLLYTGLDIVGWQAVAFDEPRQIQSMPGLTIWPDQFVSYSYSPPPWMKDVGVWLGTTSRWYNLSGTCRRPVLIRSDLKAPYQSQWMNLPRLASDGSATYPRLLGALDSGSLLLTTSGEGATKQILCYELALAEADAEQKEKILRRSIQAKDRVLTLIPALRKRVIPLPAKAELREVELSADGQRLAWVFYFREPTPRHEPYLYHSAALWISQSDGSQMHPVGEMTIEAPMNRYSVTRNLYSATLQLQWLRWVPGGKAVSFRSRNVLYELPIAGN